MSIKILLTGADGFVGSALYKVLTRQNHCITCAVREKKGSAPARNLFGHVCCFDHLDGRTDFGKALNNIDIVIHLAAHAPQFPKADPDLQKECMAVNFEGTRNLANQASQKGVKRFIFVSSVAVNGKSTENGVPYTEKDEEAPYDWYTISKLKAEQALREIGKDTGLEIVIIRPPLVYGPGVKANFLKLMHLIHTGLPLPFKGLKNQRSFIFIDNLADAIAQCAVNDKIKGETFLVSDDYPLSTPQLVEKISIAMGLKPRLFFLPSAVLRRTLSLFKKERIYESLWGNLFVDSTKFKRYTGWYPKVSIDEGIQKTVQWYLNSQLK